MSAIRRAVRLALAMERWEVLLLAAGAILLGAAALVVAWQMREVRTDELACYAAAPPAVEGSTGMTCPQFLAASETLSTLQRGMGLPFLVAPVMLGLFLALPVVARELDHRTAPIAWTLSRSRARWLLMRTAPVVGLVAVLSAVLAIAAEVMWRASPWAEGLPDLGFAEHGSHGPLMVARGVAAAGVGLAAGAIVARQLGGLLLAVLLSAALLFGTAIVMDAWMETDAEWVELGTPADSRIFDMAYREDATGQVVSFNDFYSYDGGQIAVADDGEPEGMTAISLLVPAERAGEWIARESMLLALISLGASGAALLSVRTRRVR
jgi:hypothetical protein